MPGWTIVRVELVHGRGIDFDPAPGRLLLVGPRHTFGQLADAINIHFARWDRSHLHEFTLADGREVGFIDDDAPDTIDQDTVTVSELGEDEEFRFVFDFGDEWEHRCRVEEVDVDPEELYGKLPQSPVPIFGWGSIPDQYGRESDDG